MRSQKSLTTKHLLLIVRLKIIGKFIWQDICDEVYGASPLPQRLARKYRRRGTDAAGVLLLRQGIRDNAYGALSAAFPTMHILEDKI